MNGDNIEHYQIGKIILNANKIKSGAYGMVYSVDLPECIITNSIDDTQVKLNAGKYAIKKINIKKASTTNGNRQCIIDEATHHIKLSELQKNQSVSYIIHCHQA